MAEKAEEVLQLSLDLKYGKLSEIILIFKIFKIFVAKKAEEVELLKLSMPISK